MNSPLNQMGFSTVNQFESTLSDITALFSIAYKIAYRFIWRSVFQPLHFLKYVGYRHLLVSYWLMLLTGRLYLDTDIGPVFNKSSINTKFASLKGSC